MGFNGQGIVKRSVGMEIPIVVELRVKHEGLGFGNTLKNNIITKINFEKEKYVTYLAFS